MERKHINHLSKSNPFTNMIGTPQPSKVSGFLGKKGKLFNFCKFEKGKPKQTIYRTTIPNGYKTWLQRQTTYVVDCKSNIEK